VDCYWREPPSDDDRRRPIRVLGADLGAFWDYDESEEEWSEDYQLGALSVTISNFTVATAERFLDAVLNDCDLDPVKHYRLAAISSCRALRGAHTLDGWQQRVAAYPDALVLAVVETVLNPDALPGWTARQALAERGDTIAVHSLLAAVTQGIFNALLAINRTFRSHRVPKWQRHVLGNFALRPAGLASRMDEIWHQETPHALVEAEALVYDTIDLAERELGLHLDGARAALAERRRAIEPPAIT
jgi:hypothetical protein